MCADGTSEVAMCTDERVPGICPCPGVDAGADDASTADAGADDASTVDDASTADASDDGGVDGSSGGCEANERVEGNACVACPVDETNAAGDDPTGEDTLCDDVCAVALGVRCSVFAEAELVASNLGLSDHFGASVALEGDTLVVGAPGEDSDATGVNGDEDSGDAENSGAVYVFTRSGSFWTQQAYIKASNTSADDAFGTSVALSGDTLVVGAPGRMTPTSGSAYVFTRSGTTWSQQAYLNPSNYGGEFGGSVALEGDIVAVGASFEWSSATGVGGNQSDTSAMWSGAVYVFARAGTVWTQQAYIKASNTGAQDQFGSALALSGETLAVGAPWEDSNATGVGGDQTNESAEDSGAVYVFTRSAAAWSQQAYLKASNTGADDSFGDSVALSGETLAVGAFREASDATGVNGDQDNDRSLLSGAVYVFTRSATTWSQQAYLKASNAGGAFGASLALEDDTLAVGATYEASSASGLNGDQDDESQWSSGAVYLFVRSGATWTQRAYIKSSDPFAEHHFGSSLALDGDTLAVGESGYENGYGAAYVRRVSP